MDRASLRLGCEKRHGDGKTARLEVFSIDGSTTGLNTGFYNGESKTYAPAFAVSHSLRTVKCDKKSLFWRQTIGDSALCVKQNPTTVYCGCNCRVWKADLGPARAWKSDSARRLDYAGKGENRGDPGRAIPWTQL